MDVSAWHLDPGQVVDLVITTSVVVVVLLIMMLLAIPARGACAGCGRARWLTGRACRRCGAVGGTP